MNNLISVFMNYKVNRLVEYGVAIYGQDSAFIRQVFSSYFQTYIDNYYYGIFNTIEDEDNFNRKNLKTEFTGVMEEMLYDYQEYETKLAEDIYKANCNIIRELRDLSYEIVRMDTLNYSSKDEIPFVVRDFIGKNDEICKYLTGHEEKLIRLVRDTYLTNLKLFQYENDYYDLDWDYFIDHEDYVWLKLIPTIKSLNVYKNGLVQKTYQDERLDLAKAEALIQKVSHLLLLNFINKKESKLMFLELPDSLFSRGKMDERIESLIDNPMFQKNVVLVVPYNTYLSQKNAFSVDYQLACIQDFSRIADIYQKVEAIYNEGVFGYLIVRDCRYDDRDFFLKYQNSAMSVLMFEED